MMKNLTTPQSVLFGLGLIALAIASLPYTSKEFTYKISICDSLDHCAYIFDGRLTIESKPWEEQPLPLAEDNSSSLLPTEYAKYNNQ